MSKRECSIFRLDGLCRHSWQGGSCLQPWEASLHSCPSLQEHFIPFYWLMSPKQMQTSQLPHLWNTLILQSCRQFLLQYPPGVPILGRTTLNIREKEKREGQGWWAFEEKENVMSACKVWHNARLCQMLASKHIVGPVSVKNGFWAVDCSYTVNFMFSLPESSSMCLRSLVELVLTACGAAERTWCCCGEYDLSCFNCPLFSEQLPIFFCNNICTLSPGHSVCRFCLHISFSLSPEAVKSLGSLVRKGTERHIVKYRWNSLCHQ